MTLIVGIKCSNGIVVGADGAASLGVMGQMTALQPVKKLAIIQSKIILGVSGPIGLFQRIQGIVPSFPHLTGRSKTEVMGDLRKAIWKDILQLEFEAATLTSKVIGPAANLSCVCSAMFALPVKNNELALIHLDQNASPEAASDDLPFAAIGSGQPLADPFLAFIRRIFWPGRLPNLAEGEFAIWWTLHHAIKTAPGGIAEPKQMAVLQIDAGKVIARELSSAEMQEHEEAVGNAERHLSEFQKHPSPLMTPVVPAPPAAAAAEPTIAPT
ncbi:hypothetical protein [Fontivita pretiosa]|uniref:hypothetical protein n=1 Tax=Fontivita pretiosa TaxID=2989684 RepID=UPI003D169FD4